MEGELPSQRITEGVIWKQLLFFFFPILLGSFFQQMYNTVDTIIFFNVFLLVAYRPFVSYRCLLLFYFIFLVRFLFGYSLFLI